ncbi:MAG: GerMN domain-containing protein [Armatimonadota bacterium]
MARKKSTPRAATPLFAAAVLIIAIASLAVWYNKSIKTTSHPGADIPAVQHQKPDHGTVVKPKRKVNIYVMKIVGMDPRLVPVERSVPADADPHRAALEALLATNTEEAAPAKYLIPQGTKLIGVKIKKRTAYADFSKEIRDNFTGGSMNEALLVNAIVHTLAQFDDVKKVQIMVEGKKVESLGGHLDISQPLEGDSTLLSKGDAE